LIIFERMSSVSIKLSLSEFYKTRDFESFEKRSLHKQKDLEELLLVALDDQDELPSILASWVCTHLVEKDKKVFQAALPEIVRFLERTHHQSSLRNFMKILTHLEVTFDYQGRVLDLCTQFISDSNNKVALQIYSMQTLLPLMHVYPELFPEFVSLIELHSTNKSPAYHTAFRNFRKKTKNTTFL
jgi:hypothetical protein